MNIFSRATRLAAQERWNVPLAQVRASAESVQGELPIAVFVAMPQVPDSSAPSVINIQVTTEMGGDMDKRMSKNPNVNMDEVRRTDWKTARQ